MRGIETGQGQMLDLAIALKVCKMAERGVVSLIPVVLPVELEQIKCFYARPLERNIHRPFDDFAGHRTRIRHPFGELLHLGELLAAVWSGKAAARLADKVFGWTV